LRDRPGLYRELLAKQHGKVPSIVATPHKQPA
jgi:ATP-binding cassette subfamily B protein